MFYKIINFGMWVWDKIYLLLKICSIFIISIMNIIILPDKNNGKIKAWRLILWLSINIVLIFIVMYQSSKDTNINIKLLFSICLLIFHLLVIIAKMVMITEDNLVMEGVLHKDKTLFRKFQASIPMQAIYISGIMIFVSLTLTTYWFDKIFSLALVGQYKNAEVIDYAIFLVIQLLLPIYQYAIDTSNVFISYQTLIPAVMSFILYAVFWTLLYSAVILGIQQVKAVKTLVQSLASDDSDIPYIQQRAARYPNFIKKELIDLSINHPNHVVRRRAISIMPHAKVVSFPSVYIYNLHKELDSDIKEWGMKKVLEILTDPEIIYDKDKKEAMLKGIRYQRKKQHSDKIQQLLLKSKEKITSSNV